MKEPTKKELMLCINKLASIMRDDYGMNHKHGIKNDQIAMYLDSLGYISEIIENIPDGE
jgi:hypothetical protein